MTHLEMIAAAIDGGVAARFERLDSNVLFVLLRHANTEGRTCVGATTIARALGTSDVRGIERIRQSLIASELLAIDEQRPGCATVYRLQVDNFAAAVPAPKAKRGNRRGPSPPVHIPPGDESRPPPGPSTGTPPGLIPALRERPEEKEKRKTGAAKPRRRRSTELDPSAPPGPKNPLPLPTSLDTPPLREAWARWNKNLREQHAKTTNTAHEGQIAFLETIGPERALAALIHSTNGSYIGIYEPKGRSNDRQHQQRRSASERGEYAEPDHDLPIFKIVDPSPDEARRMLNDE